MPDSPVGKKVLNMTLTQGVLICDPGIKVPIGAYLGEESWMYKNTKIKKFISKKPENTQRQDKGRPQDPLCWAPALRASVSGVMNLDGETQIFF